MLDIRFRRPGDGARGLGTLGAERCESPPVMMGTVWVLRTGTMGLARDWMLGACRAAEAGQEGLRKTPSPSDEALTGDRTKSAGAELMGWGLLVVDAASRVRRWARLLAACWAAILARTALFSDDCALVSVAGSALVESGEDFCEPDTAFR